MRGIAVCLMILDHVMYDLWGLMPNVFVGYPQPGIWLELRNLAISYWRWDVRKIVRQFILFIFLGLVGVSCSFSRSNFKRGLKLLAVSLAITVGTYVVGLVGDMMDDILIVFGILHMMSVSLLLISLIEVFTKNKWVYLIIGVALVVAGRILYDPLARHVELSYSSAPFLELFFQAFIGKILLGPDCYSFLYFGGQVFIGVFLGKLLYPERRSLLFKKGYLNNPLTFMGRHALAVYVVHQVLIPVILGAILLICGYSLAV